MLAQTEWVKLPEKRKAEYRAILAKLWELVNKDSSPENVRREVDTIWGG